MKLFIFLLAFSLHAQITSTPTSVTAKVPGLTCTFTAAGGICQVILPNGTSVPYDLWTPPLVQGADASVRGFEWNGAVINPTLHMAAGIVTWAVAIQPNGGVWTRANGAFAPAGPPPGPVIVGSMQNGVCQTVLPLFVVAGSTINSNQVPGICVLP